MNVDPSLEIITTPDGVFAVAQRTGGYTGKNDENHMPIYAYSPVLNGRRARFEITAPNTQTLVNVCSSSYEYNILYSRTNVILKISGISTANTSVQSVAPVLSLVVFSSGSTNSGTTSQRTIFNSSTNSGTVSTAVFQGSTNSLSGVVTGKATFRAGSTNDGTLTATTSSGQAGFVFRNSTNNGTINGNASFYDSPNSGTLNNDGLFSGGSAINTGTVNGHAIFLSGSSNEGGTVEGDSFWRDTTVFSSSAIFGTCNALYFGYGTEGTDVSITVAEIPYEHRNGLTLQDITASHWYSDSSTSPHIVSANINVTQDDEGGGVMSALFNTGYLNVGTINGIGYGDYTFETFVKFASAPTNNPYDFELLYSQGDENLSIARFWNGTIEVAKANIDNVLYSTSVINDTNWHHVAVVRSSSIIYIYIDGDMVGSAADNNNYPDHNTFIGRVQYAPALYMKGKMTGVRLVVGSALYSGNTLTVPTSLPTDISNTELLLNFGATVAPTVDSSASTTAASWLSSNGTNVAQYTGAGSHYNQWGYNNAWYNSQALAQAAKDADTAASWLSSNGTNVAQYTGAGSHYNQWGYNNAWYNSQALAQAAKDADTAASWLSSNGMSVTQYTGAGTYYNKWGYNNAWYNSQALAQAAKDGHDAAAASWLSSNGMSVTQYTGAGSRNGQWGYNNVWYDTEEEAQTAAGV